MRDHFSLTDDIFERQFADCSFDPELFTHEAHLRLAWIHIRKYGIDQAIRNICSQIRQYTISLGATDKYNETVTIAGIRAVYHFMLKSETETFSDFIAGNPRLKFNFKELLGLHYNTNIFISDKAKKTYLEPELLPFD
jgi:hypothetical protein